MIILAALAAIHALIAMLSFPALFSGRRSWPFHASLIAIACPLAAPFFIGAFILKSVPYFNMHLGYAYCAAALYTIGLLASVSSLIGHLRRKSGTFG